MAAGRSSWSGQHLPITASLLPLRSQKLARSFDVARMTHSAKASWIQCFAFTTKFHVISLIDNQVMRECDLKSFSAILLHSKVILSRHPRRQQSLKLSTYLKSHTSSTWHARLCRKEEMLVECLGGKIIESLFKQFHTYLRSQEIQAISVQNT